MTTEKRIRLKKNEMLNLLREIAKEENKENFVEQFLHYLRTDMKTHGTDYFGFIFLLSRYSKDFQEITKFHVYMMNHPNEKIQDLYVNDLYHVVCDGHFSETDFGKYFSKTCDSYKRKYGDEREVL